MYLKSWRICTFFGFFFVIMNATATINALSLDYMFVEVNYNYLYMKEYRKQMYKHLKSIYSAQFWWKGSKPIDKII